MIKTLAFTALFGISTAFSHFHEPAIELVFDNLLNKQTFKEPGFVHLSVFHQSSLMLENDHVVLLHVLNNPYSHKKHHSEVGVGYRKLFDNWGFGLNFVHAGSNVHGPYNHQFCPGLEISYGHLDVAFNRYMPLFPSLEYKGKQVDYHDVSEIVFAYKPSRKYEFALTPYFNHQTSKAGVSSSVAAYVFDDWKLCISPFYDSASGKGVSFSLGFHFGGAKGKVNQNLRKTHRFHSTSLAQITAPNLHTPVPTLPTDGPMVLPPIEEEKPVSPSEKKSWLDYLFFWSGQSR